MVVIGLYIYDDNNVAHRIDLFEDEKITVNSSIQNINDMGKVFTDFSQSFTVPASRRNNAIFRHWYESIVMDGFDARTRKKAYIELDTIPFRIGKIQIEKAKITKGVPDNYTITFFGNLISLKDLFGERKLRELDFSSMDFEYSGTLVKTRISSGVTNDIKFPLISSSNVWQYGGNGAAVSNWDISNTATPIYNTDLFPAIRVSSIFNIIASNYGLEFDGDFIDNDKFKNAFLWLKNSEKFELKLRPTKINFTTSSSTTGSTGLFVLSPAGSYLNFTLPTGTNYVSQSHINLTFTSSGVPFTFYIYKDGVELSKQSYVTQTSAMYLECPLDISGRYTFLISANSTVTYTSQYYFEIGNNDSGYVKLVDLTVNQPTAQSNSLVLNIADYMPDLKIQDFFSGILKMFNLTCFSEKDGVYTVEQLTDWYNKGKFYDFTKYTIQDEIEVIKPKSYKKINFNYSESESLLNTNFKSRNSANYGDLLYEMPNDGEEYSIEIPFENIMFNRFTGTDLQVAYSVDINFNSVIPAAVILYDYNETKNCSFKFNDGTSTSTITEYNVFGQDTKVDSVNHSINFGIEQSSLLGTLQDNSLFKEYYWDYLYDVLNINSRIISLKMILPAGIISNLKLNDHIIIRDKRYLINSMQSDLNTGIVTFELLIDFTNVNSNITPPVPAETFIYYTLN